MKKQSKPVVSGNENEPLTPAQIEFLNKERKKHFNGESKSYTWEEVKDRIRERKIS